MVIGADGGAPNDHEPAFGAVLAFSVVDVSAGLSAVVVAHAADELVLGKENAGADADAVIGFFSGSESNFVFSLSFVIAAASKSCFSHFE